MTKLFSIISLTLLLTSCYQTTNRTLENEKKLRYNHISEEYEYAREDERLRYNHVEDSYSYE